MRVQPTTTATPPHLANKEAVEVKDRILKAMEHVGVILIECSDVVQVF